MFEFLNFEIIVPVSYFLKAAKHNNLCKTILFRGSCEAGRRATKLCGNV